MVELIPSWWRTRPAVAPDGRHAYLSGLVPGPGGPAVATPRDVLVVDVAADTPAVVDRITADGFRAAAQAAGLLPPNEYLPLVVQVSPDGRTLYVGLNNYTRPLWAVDLVTKALRQLSVTNCHPVDIAVSPDGGFVHCLVQDLTGPRSVVVVDAHGGAVVASPSLGIFLSRQMARTPGGEFLCVIEDQASATGAVVPGLLHVVALVDHTPGPVPSVGVPVGRAPVGVAATDDRAYVANTNTDTGSVTVVPLRPGLGGRREQGLGFGSKPAGIAVTSGGHWLFVLDGHAGTVLLLDGRTLEILPVDLPPVGPSPSALAMSGDDRLLCVRTTDPTGMSTLRVPPVVLELRPSSLLASPLGGTLVDDTRVRIVGTSLDGGTAVLFGDTPALDVRPGPGPLGSTLDVVPPPGSGQVGVTVTTDAGTTTAGDDGTLFTYVMQPTITALHPGSLPPEGGQLRIEGFAFDEADAVLFGDEPQVTEVTDITVGADGFLAVTAPGHDSGTVDVRVRTPVAPSPPVGLTYAGGPTLTSLSSDAGPLSGIPIVIRGSGLAVLGTPEVLLDGRPIGPVAVDGSALRVTLPRHDAGTVEITVRTPVGTSDPQSFRYVAVPTVDRLDPPGGDGGPLTIHGTGLADTPTVTVGGTPLPTATPVDDRTLRTTLPAHADGRVEIVVRTPGGPSAPATYTYTPPPHLDRLDPAVGPLDAGTITLLGTGLPATDTVLVDGTAVDGFTVGDATVTVPLPAHAAGRVAIQVHNPAGTSNPLDFTHVPRPTLDVPEPPLVGRPQQQITLTGRDLGPVEKLTIGTTAIPRPKLVIFGVGGTTLRFFAPPGTGTVDITVTSPGGTSNPVAFTYS